MSGYVLLLDDITADRAAQSRRDRRMIELTEIQPRLAGQHAGGAGDAGLSRSETRSNAREFSRRLSAMRSGSGRPSCRTDRGRRRRILLTRWPLRDVQGGDFIGAVAQRIEADAGRSLTRDQVEDGLWLSVDSFSLMQALAFLAAGRLVETLFPDVLDIRLNRAGAWAHLDLAWPALTSAVAPAGWQAEAMPQGEGTTS
ncbi:hypothetical protein PE067_17925 [Paracoccus sp. DMF-8]|uniref:hypothetical protein n=1 Tax=Paracoccus sp. DMF-8 TaxID=3019445 RepID=UPI0023E35E46|nr:hypothetical protein [Paracoccus sp. DMF-8]MDF3607855.1 hypothetical protein [Paracoccus sp. DMF-8]